ncbi:MAG: hypothetical protein JWP12_2444 [Bacteroidetes bacterium]|nr:hypothetical protein [Bacteroidota bacterium]
MFLFVVKIVALITAVLCILYTALIARYCYGWIKTRSPGNKNNFPVTIAVIVAARNEEKNIAECLDKLLAQTYPAANVEIIVMDDHSTDLTGMVIQRYTEKYRNVKLISLAETSGKKNAIAAAIAVTQAELIVTTDADCTMGKNWLETIVGFYSATDSKMIVAPVAFTKPVSVFEKMQSLEFMALMGSTAGSLYFNAAILCNGANLAYTRAVFNELNGFSGIDGGASGDDVLLMYKIAEKYPEKIRFLKDAEAIVYTPAKKTFSEFMNQRKRWASKGFGAMNPATRMVSVLVYSVSFMLLFMGFLTGFAALKSAVYLPFFEFCLIMTGIKCIIDFLLLFLAASFFKRKHELFLFLPEQLLYMLYVVVVGMLGSTGKYEWKGRKF